MVIMMDDRMLIIVILVKPDATEIIEIAEPGSPE